MMTEDEPTDASLEFSARRAKGMARKLADTLIESDVPRPHWDEVLEHLKEMLADVVGEQSSFG